MSHYNSSYFCYHFAQVQKITRWKSNSQYCMINLRPDVMNKIGTLLYIMKTLFTDILGHLHNLFGWFWKVLMPGPIFTDSNIYIYCILIFNPIMYSRPFSHALNYEFMYIVHLFPIQLCSVFCCKSQEQKINLLYLL